MSLSLAGACATTASSIDLRNSPRTLGVVFILDGISGAIALFHQNCLLNKSSLSRGARKIAIVLFCVYTRAQYVCADGKMPT